MSVETALKEISSIYSTLGAGSPDVRLMAVYYQHLAVAYSELAEEMASAAGWSAPTGTATRTSFDTATVTLPQLAERVKAIIDDQLSRGEFGP